MVRSVFSHRTYENSAKHTHTIQRANCGVEMDIRKVILKTDFEVGPIDVIISNAGIPANGGTEVPNDEWDRIWRVNVMQHVFVARHLFPLYKSRGYGAMLITASAAGLLTQIGSLPYAVTKHAAVSVADGTIAHRSDNIRISVCVLKLSRLEWYLKVVTAVWLVVTEHWVWFGGRFIQVLSRGGSRTSS